MASTTATRRSGRYYVTRNAEGKLIHVPIDDQRGKYYVARDANGKLIKVPMGQEPPTSASSIDNNTAAVAGAAVAAAKKKSKLTDAERTRLKGVLKEALSKPTYSESFSDGIGGKPKRFVVLCINASEDEFLGEMPELAEEVLLEDPQTFFSYYARPYITKRDTSRSTARKTSTTSARSASNSNPVIGIAPVEAHPSWYMGFWKGGTYIEISSTTKSVSRSSEEPALPVEPTIAKVEAIFGERPDPVALRWMLPRGGCRKTIASYVDGADHDGHVVLPFDGAHLVGHEVFHTLETGTIVVWNADKWQNHIVEERLGTIHRGGLSGTPLYGTFRFFDPDLFDNITLRISSRCDTEITISRIVIQLNGVTILDDPDPITIPGAGTVSLTLKNKILSYRLRSLLHDRDLTPTTPVAGYDPDEITSNPVLTVAANELGKAWCQRYNSWDKTDGVWNDTPGVWCGGFTAWGIREEGTLRDLTPPYPFPDDWRNAEWFKKTNRLYYPGAAIDYAQLGDLVKPGYFANIRGHAAFFVYWIKTPPVTKRLFRRLRTGAVVARAEENGDINDQIVEWLYLAELLKYKPAWSDYLYEPGEFEPSSDINWFCHISGSNGGRVRMGCAAVVCSKKWNQVLVNELLNNPDFQSKGIPWCREFPADTAAQNPEEWAPLLEISNGFGRVSGLEPTAQEPVGPWMNRSHR